MKLGIHEGDIVAVIAVSLPEVIYSFYGLNRIGAVANMIDPRTSAEGIKDYFDEADVKTVVVIDVAYQKIIKAIENTSVKNVVVVSPADSLPALKKTTVVNRTNQKSATVKEQRLKYPKGKFVLSKNICRGRVLLKMVRMKN